MKIVLVLVVGRFGMRTTDQRPSTRTRTTTIFEGIAHEPDGSPRRMKIVLVVVLVVGRF